MDTPVWLRRTFLGLLAAVLAAVALFAATARASELPVAGTASGLNVHDAAETLRDFCVEQDGRLWLCLPGGARFELVTSTADDAIANAGDGSFHPFDRSEVLAALAAVDYPLDGVPADVFLLPYPRRAGLESAAAPELILLSPGVLPLSREHQQAELVHELGHVVQYARMPDGADAWDRYRQLRGITDPSVYNAAGPHANRPHEIFAEDFRALFGGSLANYSGTIENPDLAMPATVSGLDPFMRSLAATTTSALSASLAAFPNPSRGAMSFARTGTTAASLDVYDLAGRRIATLAPETASGGFAWRWDGRDATGAPAGAGVFFARARDGRGGVLRITRLR
jgi:hypothetical protein